MDAQKYAEWLVNNASLKGTPEFDTVAQAYQAARGSSQDEPPSAYTRGTQVTNPISRGVNSALGGPLLGFWDEIAGGISAPFKSFKSGKPIQESYREGRDFIRGIQDQYQQDFPIAGPITQAMTSAPLAAVPASVPLLGAKSTSAAIGPTKAILGASGTGATYGAISGAGESKADELSDLLYDTGMGAVRGAVTSGALQGAATGGSAVVRNVASKYSPVVADNFARQKVAEAIARDGRGQVFEDGLANPVTQAQARLRKLGPEARVVDAGGQNTRQLLDTLTTLPGRTKNATENAILTRQSGRGGRLTDAADLALGTGGRRLNPTLEALEQTRSQAAAPYYNQLRNVMVEVDDDVANLLTRTKGVHGEAEKLWRLQTGQEVSLGNVGKGQQIPFSMLDTLKQSLYDASSTAKRQGGNKMGMALDDVRVSLTGKLDDLAPKDDNGQSIYKLARDAYAGPSQMMDAAELGSKAMTSNLATLRQEMRGLSRSEMEAFKIGAVQSLREKAGTQSGQTSLTKMWMEPNTQERLKLIFGNDYREFAAAVAREARLKGLDSVGRGSQTAARQFGAGDLDVSPLVSAAGAANSAAAGSPVGVIANAANLWNRVQTPERVRNQMGSILLQQGQSGANSLNDLAQIIEQINRQQATQIGAFGTLGGQTGLLGQ